MPQQPRRRQQSVVSSVVSRLGFALMHGLTLPYYRFFRQNTLLPILAIAKAIDVRRDEEEIRSMVARWRARKLYELHYIQIALGPAAWYSCLILSLFAISLSSSEAFTLTNFRAPGPILVEQPPLSSNLHAEVSMIIRLEQGLGDGEQDQRQRTAAASPDDREKDKAASPPPPPPPARALVRWNMVFTWQAPMAAVLLRRRVPDGRDCLRLHTLVRRRRLLGRKSAVFVWCSFWAYKFVDLDHV
ncbi:uncharacterized protein PG986_013170 [Apiospora aurea]|uniref:Uncharacterized protein n=1 Tax=Apiospora aurea TaxID=335848 RepID=A0ABR1PUU1_9PEZI